MLLSGTGLCLLILAVGRKGKLGSVAERRANQLLSLDIHTRHHTSQSFWRLPGICLLSVGLIFTVPILLITGSEQKAPFNNAWLDEINTTAPDTVFIGNSMIASRLDQKRFSQLTGGARAKVIWIPGSNPREWYLMLKYSVLPAKAPPRTVVMAFLNREFLDSSRGLASENHRERVEALTPSHTGLDPVFEKLVLGHPTKGDKFTAFLRDRLRVGVQRYVWRDYIGNVAFQVSQDTTNYQSIPKNRRINVLLNHINTRLGFTHLRDDIYFLRMEQKRDPSNYDFEQLLPGSFLPHIVRLCRDAGIRLLLVRIKPRPFSDGHIAADNPRNKALIHDLETYLSDQGVHFLNLRGEPGITRELFGSGDHIDWGEGQIRWTEIFHQRSRHLIP
jgi:hypothetical protein